MLLLLALNTQAQREFPLYNGPVPNSLSVPNEEVDNGKGVVSKVSIPTLTAFLPPKEKANGAAVIVCPGGGYGVLVIEREGYAIARAFAEMGVAAFVLKYRLPSPGTMANTAIGPLQDAQQAIRTVRQRAAEWNVDPQKIGIMGFSAGGHLAATAGTHFKVPLIDNPEKTSLRPDFLILVYPVISFQESLSHGGSRSNLLGTSASREAIDLYSNELQVDAQTPPAFLTHASDDSKVPVANSLVFYQALLRHQVPAEMHIYAKGEHGYGKTPAFEEWFGRCRRWLATSGLIP
ncbi:alpha/beta hydrolase [Rhabdobacter roseus]